MTEQTPEQGGTPDTSSSKPQAPAAPAAPATVETVRLVLVPDVFTHSYVAFSATEGQITVNKDGANVPADEAEEIIATAAGLGVVLKEED